METFRELLIRLRVERGLTQDKLASKAGCSLNTIARLEITADKKIRTSTARAIYHALAAIRPLPEADAAEYMAHTGLSRLMAGIPAGAPAMLDTSDYLREAASGRVRYLGSGPADRPDVPTETIYAMGCRPGSRHGEPAALTPDVLQAAANLVVAYGPEQAARMMQSLLTMLSASTPPPDRPLSPLSPSIPRPPPGALAIDRSTPEVRATEYVPISKPKKPQKPTTRRRKAM